MIVTGYIFVGVICILGILAVIGCAIHTILPPPLDGKSRVQRLGEQGIL